MPTTARQIIDAAYSIVGVRPADTALTAGEIQEGLEFLNDILAQWQGAYTELGAMPVDNASDNVRIPRWAVRHTKFQLALSIASPLEVELSTTDVANMKIAEAFFNKALVGEINVQYPDSLPVGSGNGCHYLYRRRYFDRQRESNF